MLYGVVFMVLGCAGMLAADTTPWRIVPPLKTDKLLPELPPLAVVERRDDSGKTWRIEGSLGGTRVVAESDFKLCFERQGLRLDKVISIGRDKQSLYLWRRGGKGIILMLHETGVARTDFAVGLDDSPSQAAGRPLARNLPHGLTEAQTGEEFKQRQ
jgi:hypothetical protein